jgi:hypothetical protein
MVNSLDPKDLEALRGVDAHFLAPPTAVLIALMGLLFVKILLFYYF